MPVIDRTKELTTAHDTFLTPKLSGFARLTEGETRGPKGVYLWSLVGARLRCIRGSSSIIYVGKGDPGRALGHHDSDAQWINHYSLQYLYSYWRRAGKLDVWFKPVPDEDATETLLLHGFFRFHYQVPIFNKQAKGHGGSLHIRDIFGDEVWSEVSRYLRAAPSDPPFGLVEGEEATLGPKC